MKKTISLIIFLWVLVGFNCIMANRLKEKHNNVETLTTTATTMTTTATQTTTKKVVKTTRKKQVKKVVEGTKGEYQTYAKQVGGYDDTQMSCLINLWNRESGWNPNAKNRSTGACGIPQAYPCNKIAKQQGSNDWKAQIRWGINYIKNRYGSPCNAWKHFTNKHWY